MSSRNGAQFRQMEVIVANDPKRLSSIMVPGLSELILSE
jgi:hypothetical protein